MHEVEGLGFRIHVLRSTWVSCENLVGGYMFHIGERNPLHISPIHPYDPNHLHSIPKALTSTLNLNNSKAPKS